MGWVDLDLDLQIDVLARLQSSLVVDLSSRC